ncbi:MAG: hypothetical protein PVI41_07690 [Roseobacter sp.]|jgi:hypothetical protein
MTLKMAKDRRVRALTARCEDRILVKPAAHHSQVQLPADGTAAAYLIDSLVRGCRAEQLALETGWSKSTVMVNIYKVAKKCGVGVRRRDDTMHLVLPEGSSRIYPRAKIVASESTMRSMAADVVISPA